MAWDYGRRGVAGSARAVCAVDKVPSFTLWTLSDSNRFDRNNLIAWIGNTNRFTFSIPSVCPYYQIGGAESKYDDNSFHLCLGLACWPLMAALQLQLLEERTSCSGRCMIIKNQLLIKGCADTGSLESCDFCSNPSYTCSYPRVGLQGT